MLKLIFMILCWLYGLLMGTSATLMFHQGKLSLGLWVINCLGGLLLILGQYTRPIITILGLAVLLLAAILNGLALNNTINPLHLFIRLTLSLLIGYLAFTVFSFS